MELGLSARGPKARPILPRVVATISEKAMAKNFVGPLSLR
jgi:hypothetical protein